MSPKSPISIWAPTHHHQPSSHPDTPASIVRFCLRVSKTIDHLKQTHSYLLRSSAAATPPPPSHHRLLARLLASLLSFSAHPTYARQVFDQIPNCQDQFLWTSLIRRHVAAAQFHQSISLYAKMHRLGVRPSGFTFSAVLNACARVPALFQGEQIHVRALASGFCGNKFVQAALLNVRVKCGSVVEARAIFDGMIGGDRDVVVWTTMICGYAKTGMMDDARKLFDKMPAPNVVSWGTMVAGYASCGNMGAARELFDSMPEKNPVARLAMISGYAKCGDVTAAKRVFRGVPADDAACWAAMVACYAQNGYWTEAIQIYNTMRREKVKTSEVAVVGAISACAQLRDVEVAATLVDHVEEGCCERTPYVSTALIHMHAKCGSIDMAWGEFQRTANKDVVCYSALMTALADHGRSQEALDLLTEMLKEGIGPDKVTFVGVLSACSHAGLLEEGCKNFELMTQMGIEPVAEHCACMVDLFGRAGLIGKAYNLIKEHASACDAGVWGSLLGACKIHGNIRVGEIAARQLLKMAPGDMGNYALLANIYASASRWEDAAKVREMMRERRMEKKTPGSSWVSRS